MDFYLTRPMSRHSTLCPSFLHLLSMNYSLLQYLQLAWRRSTRHTNLLSPCSARCMHICWLAASAVCTSELTRQALHVTVIEGIVQGSYVATRVKYEVMIFCTQGTEPTTEPPRLTIPFSFTH